MTAAAARQRPTGRKASLHSAPLAHSLPALFVQESFDSPIRRTYEQVLRRLLRMPSTPAVLLLQAYPWWQAFGDGVTEGLFYREPENELTVLGQVRPAPQAGRLQPRARSSWRCLSRCPRPCATLFERHSRALQHRRPVAPPAPALQYYDLPVLSLRRFAGLPYAGPAAAGRWSHG